VALSYTKHNKKGYLSAGPALVAQTLVGAALVAQALGAQTLEISVLVANCRWPDA